MQNNQLQTTGNQSTLQTLNLNLNKKKKGGRKVNNRHISSDFDFSVKSVARREAIAE